MMAMNFKFLVYDVAGGEPREVQATDVGALLLGLPERPAAVSVWHPIRHQWESVDDLADYERQRMVQSGQPARDLDHAKALGQETWDTADMQRDFQVEGFVAPFVVVRRKSNGKRGTLEFTHSPRVYFGWKES